MKSNENNDIPHILKVDQWDENLPTGDWTGPDPLPLYPSLERANDSEEAKRAFREIHIQFHPTEEQNQKIQNWVNANIPEDIRWLFHGLDFNHVQFQKLFFASPQVHNSNEAENSDFRSQHPTVFNDDWDSRLDTYRSSFISKLKDIGCSFQYVTENEAIDNGMLNIPGYERPRFCLLYTSPSPRDRG